MTFLQTLRALFAPPPQPQPAPEPKLLFTSNCIEALAGGLKPALQRRHEGIVYLLGRTDGVVTLATTVFVPVARTTYGSFFVEPRSMAACMQAAAVYDLQVVGQVHTHPAEAFHSDGDGEGTKIRYGGYASVVLPDYGMHLPSLERAAAFIWLASAGWVELGVEDVHVIPGAGPWTRANGS